MVLGIFLSLGRQWILFSSADKQFTEYVEGLVPRAALARRSARDVRILIQAKAEQLSIPLQPEQITITGQGDKLRVDINYETEIKIPVIDHGLYRMTFRHSLTSR